jgi:predicted Rossmann-fold nucleotide-binding protein
MRVIVCGGRYYHEYETVRDVLAQLPHHAQIITGGAQGADTLAIKAAEELHMVSVTHYAEWAKYGRKAGPIRNQRIVDEGADLCIAFTGGRGTEDMIRRCKRAGIPVERK